MDFWIKTTLTCVGYLFFKCVKWVLDEVLCVLGTQGDCLPDQPLSEYITNAPTVKFDMYISGRAKCREGYVYFNLTGCSECKLALKGICFIVHVYTA